MPTGRPNLPSPPDSSATGSSPKQDATSDIPSQQESSSSPEDSNTGPAKGQSTGDFLESIARQVLDIMLNTKDLNHPIVRRHFSPDFRGKHDALPPATNHVDHMSSLQAHLDKQPQFSVTVLNTSSEVDDSRGRATVYIWYEISGLEHGLERENVSLLTWERKQGLWMITKHQGMRGPAGFFR